MNSYDLVVGGLAHRAVADLAGIGRSPGLPALMDRAWAVAGDLVKARKLELGHRARAARLVVAGVAGAFARYMLAPDWILLDSEVPYDGGRIDLSWQLPDGSIVYDELKLAGALGRISDDGMTRRQADRYLAHGVEFHGDDFRGVRLLLLGSPRHSLLLEPNSPARALVGTEMWFEVVAEVVR